MNKHEVAWLHLLPMLSRYRRMSESVHHDEQSSSLHCRKCFRYDEQRSSLHTEGLNTKKSFPICMFVVMASGKCDLHIHLTFLQEFKLPHLRKYLLFIRKLYDAMTNNQFSALDNAKWLAKHISSKFSFKITIRKRHVHIDISWPWKWKQYFYLGIREDERSKIIFLPFFSSLHD